MWKIRKSIWCSLSWGVSQQAWNKLSPCLAVNVGNGRWAECVSQWGSKIAYLLWSQYICCWYCCCLNFPFVLVLDFFETTSHSVAQTVLIQSWVFRPGKLKKLKMVFTYLRYCAIILKLNPEIILKLNIWLPWNLTLGWLGKLMTVFFKLMLYYNNWIIWCSGKPQHNHTSLLHCMHGSLKLSQLFLMVSMCLLYLNSTQSKALVIEFYYMAKWTINCVYIISLHNSQTHHFLLFLK